MAAGVSILSDLSYSMSGARSGVVSREMETGRRDDLIYIVLTSLNYIYIYTLQTNSKGL